MLLGIVAVHVAVVEALARVLFAVAALDFAQRVAVDVTRGAAGGAVFVVVLAEIECILHVGEAVVLARVDGVQADTLALVGTVAAFAFTQTPRNLALALAVLVAHEALPLALLIAKLAVVKAVLLVEVAVVEALPVIVNNTGLFTCRIGRAAGSTA